MSGFSRAAHARFSLVLKASFNKRHNDVIWLVLALCLVPIAALVLWPFLKAERGAADITEDWTRASLKAALAAVDKDEARGVLSTEAANIQRADIAKAAQDLPEHHPVTAEAKKSRNGFILAAAALIFAPCLLFGGYMALGTADPETAQKTALAAQSAEAPQTLEAAIAAVETRLESEPESGRLWAALGDLKIRNQDLLGAETALEKAVSLLEGSDAEQARLWLMLAMTRRSQGRPLSDDSIIAPLEKSLALDPASPAAILLKRAKAEIAPPAPDSP